MDEASLGDALDYVAGLGKEDILSISAMKVLVFKKIGLEAIARVQASGYYKDITDTVNDPCIKERLKAFVGYAKGFCCYKSNRAIRGPCGLSYDFYLQGGGYFRNAQLLFGIASQFR